MARRTPSRSSAGSPGPELLDPARRDTYLHPGFGVPSNLTPDPETGLGDWTREDFTRALREGISQDGRSLDPTMPVQYTKEFTDLELEAMWKYLQTLEPKPFGNR